MPNTPLSRINEYRTALDHDQRSLINAVWASYLKSPAADWPLGKSIRLEIGRREALAALSGLRAGILIATNDDRYTLTLLGVFLTKDGEDYFRLLDAYVRHLQGQRPTTMLEAPHVRDALRLSDVESRTLGKLIHLAGFWSGSARLGPEWQFGPPDNLDEIVQLESTEEYIEEQALRSSQPPKGTSTTRESDGDRGDFWFVENPSLRRLLSADRQELLRVYDAKAWKSTVILSGGILEGMLLDVLDRRKEQANEAYRQIKGRNPEPLDRWVLNELVEVAKAVGALGKGVGQLSHVLREFRDLIHPGRQLREGITISADEAEIAVLTVKICFRELAAAVRSWNERQP